MEQNPGQGPSRLQPGRQTRLSAAGDRAGCYARRFFRWPTKVLNGNTADSSTLRDFLAKIETTYGKARRVWVMDRGIPSEAILKEMREPERETF